MVESPKDSIASDEKETLEAILNARGDPGPEPVLPSHVAKFLGEQLQTFYAQLMSEPVPVRFVQLLNQLDRKGKGGHGE